MSAKFFVFWKYDQFPYVLGAEMVKMHPNGNVDPKGYQGMRFKPIKVLPLAQGRKVHAKLLALKEEHRSALDALEATFKEKLDVIMEFEG